MTFTDEARIWRDETILRQPGRPYRMVRWYGEYFKGYFVGKPYDSNEYEVEFEIGITFYTTLRCEEPDQAIVKWAVINNIMCNNIIDVEFFELGD